MTPRGAICPGRIGGMPDNPESDAAALARLRAEYPAWKFWIGKHTGRWWAAPPRGSACRSLLEADTPAALAALIAEITAWEGRR